MRPEKGRILLDGVDIAALDPGDLRRHVATCPQNPPLYSGTLRQNLSFDGAASDTVMLELLTALGAERIMPPGMGLDFEIVEGGRNLSGGQRQMVALARTLLHSGANVLILDEPTAGLDDDTERLVLQHVRRLAEERTLILISHRLPALLLTRHTAILQRGRVTRVVPSVTLSDQGERI